MICPKKTNLKTSTTRLWKSQKGFKELRVVIQCLQKEEQTVQSANIKSSKEIFEELERYNNPEHHDRSGLPFEEWTYVKGLNYIIQQAEEYLEIKEAEAKALKEQNSKLEEQRNFTLTNKSWILFFTTSLIDGILLNLSSQLYL